jgi:hypothetical protein
MGLGGEGNAGVCGDHEGADEVGEGAARGIEGGTEGMLLEGFGVCDFISLFI